MQIAEVIANNIFEFRDSILKEGGYKDFGGISLNLNVHVDITFTLFFHYDCNQGALLPEQISIQQYEIVGVLV